MTSAHKDLPAKPLIEAILEIKWRLEDNRDPVHPLYVGNLASSIASTYPYRETLAQASVPDEMLPNVVKFRFRKGPSEWPLIQAGPGIVTLNMTEDYSWHTFRQQAEFLWLNLHDAYTKLNDGNSPSVDALLLRYINAVPLVHSDPLAFVADKLHSSIALPSEVSDATPGPAKQFALSVTYQLAINDTVGGIKIQSGRRDETDVVLWELVAEGRRPSGFDDGGFQTWLDDSHKVLEDWFFSLIAGDLLNEFLGGNDGSHEE